MRAVSAATCQGRRWTTATYRLASYDTSLLVSGGVDCGRRRRNVYDKKHRRYAKDNRTAHLTARSDKSVVYVTNNKRLYSIRFVLFKLITDSYVASRGLFATAELLVYTKLHAFDAPDERSSLRNEYLNLYIVDT